MKIKQKHIHRGEILEAIIKNSDLSITQIVKRAGYSRSAYYSHIKNQKLPFEILEQYGKVLTVDFTEHFPEMIKFISFTPHNEILTLEQAIKERDLWKDKYMHLLEKYHDLIEEKLGISKK